MEAGAAAKSKFTYPAEVLPNNANTAKILKDREEKEAARLAREAQVSTLKISHLICQRLFVGSVAK